MSKTTPSPCCGPDPQPDKPTAATQTSASGCCSPAESTVKNQSCCPPPEPPATACCPPQVTSSACCPPQTETEAASCCPPQPSGSGCCPDPATERRSWERPGYQLNHFISGWISTPAGKIPRVSTQLDYRDMLGRWQMRWGIGRDRYRIAPGLYAVGSPGEDSTVLVTANYKLSFDHLRRELEGLDCWILVLETYGINVWCAAGKGTFGTEEIVHRVQSSRLAEVVNHRQLILPQLGAPGVAAHLVKQGCGFRPLYGPVRARDLPAYLAAGNQATAEMRRVHFTTLDRLILTPVELTGLGKQTLYILLAVLLLGGIGPSIYSFSGLYSRGSAAMFAFLIGLAAGAVVTPVLLPWIPGRAFAVKGTLVGAAVALATALFWPAGLGAANTAALLLTITAVSSWYAMNFTGSSTYASPSGVEKEMRIAIPAQAAALIFAGVFWIYAAF